VTVTLNFKIPFMGVKGIYLSATDSAGQVGNWVLLGSWTVAITNVTGPSEPIAVGEAATISATFTDPGALDATCSFTWNDSSPATTTTINGSTCSATHNYAAAGVYAVGLTVTDGDNNQASTTFQFVVVYDRSAGFVTGAGWIESPTGAYGPDPALTGRAHFGFVSKYQHGANVPSGTTQFQFHAAGITFKSTSYDWLVIAGAKAQFKGAGTLNGVGGYTFLLTATDGEVPGGQGADKFRIKIVNNGTGGVVYDNVRSASDNPDSANPQIIGGGNIVIHAR